MSASATDCEGAMLFDYLAGGSVMVVVLIYLVYALARPERF